jgi:hypothetical protein
MALEIRAFQLRVAGLRANQILTSKVMPVKIAG